MEKNLMYLSTMSISTFKNTLGIERVDIIKSPKTGSIFMSDEAGNSIGAVSTNITSFASDDLVVSEVCGKKEGDKPFFLMHCKKSQSALHSF